ncbi:MAG: hypothetical protein RSC80_10170 [Odoribacter sp.]
MKKLIKLNLLFTAITVLVVCSAASSIYPHPDTCKKYIIKIDIGEGGTGGATYTVIPCPDNLCYIPENQCCDFSEKCKRCNP